MPTECPDKIALITGASAGIGLALTRKLVKDNWQVIALNRSDLPADDIDLREAVKQGKLRIYNTADLADFTSLAQVLAEIKSKERRIDILFNNAGASFSELCYSPQGRERHYELMTVVPYIILMELKALIQQGQMKTVVNTSSSAIKFVRKLSIESLEQPATFRKLIGPYAAAKLALSLWTQAIAPNLAPDGIQIRSVDPGGNNTLRKGKQSGLPLLLIPLMKFFFAPPTHGADRLYAGAVGQYGDKNGIFLQHNRIATLRLQAQASHILQRVQTIYAQEYLR